MTIAEQFPIDTRVRLACAPEWCGAVIGSDGVTVMVRFQVGTESVIGTHNPDALERTDA